MQGEPFAHLLYRFVLAYSNWEAGTVCRSESFEALSEGLQHALVRCAGVPRLHASISCAVRNLKRKSGENFTERYQALLRHYGMDSQHTQPASPHENGKIEQRETVTYWVFRVPRRIFVEYPSIALDGHIRTTSYDRPNRIQRTLTGYP